MGRPKSNGNFLKGKPKMNSVYYTAANIGRNCRRGLGVRYQLYSKQHGVNPKHVKAASFLVNTCLKSLHMIDVLIKQSGLSMRLNKNDIWLARMLTTEIVFGRKSFPIFDRVSKIVYQFKNVIRQMGKESISSDKAFAFHPLYVRVCTDIISMEDMKNYLTIYDFVEVRNTRILTRAENKIYFRLLKPNQFMEDRDMKSLLVFHPKAAETLALCQASCKGQFYIQDKSSCLAAPILGPGSGAVVLDMCAAPGLKTLHLLSSLKNFGHLVAVDKSSERLNFLREHVELKKIENVTILDQDAFEDYFTEKFSNESFTHILLDAPCSGTGVTKNYDFDPDARKNKTRVQKLHNLQAKLLRRALTEFPNVRRVLYSTCSMNPTENEEVVEELIKVETDFNLVDVASHFPSLSHGSDAYPNGPKCISLTPDCDMTNGFFIALFERKGFEEPVNTSCFDTENNEVEIVSAYTAKTDEKFDMGCSLNSTFSSDSSISRAPVTPGIIDLTEESNDGNNSLEFRHESSSEMTEKSEPDVLVLSSSPGFAVPDESDDDCVEVPLKTSEGSFFDDGEAEETEALINNEVAEEVNDDVIASELGFEDIQFSNQN